MLKRALWFSLLKSCGPLTISFHCLTLGSKCLMILAKRMDSWIVGSGLRWSRSIRTIIPPQLVRIVWRSLRSWYCRQAMLSYVLLTTQGEKSVYCCKRVTVEQIARLFFTRDTSFAEIISTMLSMCGASIFCLFRIRSLFTETVVWFSAKRSWRHPFAYIFLRTKRR